LKVSDKQNEGSPALQELAGLIRSIPDFPKKGIDFKDITTLLQNSDALRQVVDHLADRYADKSVDAVVAAEARGFIFGGALACRLGAAFIPVRKKGKLPYKTYEVTYDLEYGTETIAIHQDALNPGDKVVVLDDLLATGGTIGAVLELMERLGAEVLEVAFLIELTFLKGRGQLKSYPVYSAIKL
jgi:adenine phosphoribosyltransferase